MGTTRFLSVFSTHDSLGGLDEEVLQLKGLDQIGVPDEASILDLDVVIKLIDIVHFGDTFLQCLLDSVDCSVPLHSLLHFLSDMGCSVLTIGISESIKVCNCLFSSIFRKVRLFLTRLV